jgi:hypothetical protein
LIGAAASRPTRSTTSVISEGSSFVTRLTLVLIGKARMRSAGNGLSGNCKSSFRVDPSPSHRGQASRRRITGIHLWIGATSSLGSPVMMVQVRIDSALSPTAGSRQFYQTPAKAKSDSPSGTIVQGCLAAPELCHS